LFYSFIISSKKLLFFFPIVAATVFFSCKSDKYNPEACYNQTIKPIIISNCTGSGCHNSKDRKEDLDLTTYKGLLEIVSPHHPLQSELYTVIRASGEDQMPPDHKLSKKQIDLIKSWISFGALENDCQSPACDTTNVTFSNQVSSIINKNCLGCHTSGNVILTNYAGVKAYADNGKLLNSIKRTGSLPMPPSYNLTDCEINTIAIWVSKGALNN